MKHTLLQRLIVLLCTVASLVNYDAFAEGTKTVSPTNNNLTSLVIIPYRNSGSYLNCAEDNRIYFRINDHNQENFYFGFDWRQYSNGVTSGTIPNLTDVYYRIRRPDGSVIVGPTLWNPNNAAGKINTYAQAVAGPNINGLNPAGYTPLVFDPSVNGEFWIEIYRSNNGGATMIPNGNPNQNLNWAHSPYFDMTVAKANNTVYNGRVHSDKWGFVAVQPTNGNEVQFSVNVNASSSPILFAYTDDKSIVKIEFQSNFRPVAYDVAVNNYGVVNTNNFAVNRRSINSSVSPSLLNGYKIFLNQPDSSIYTIASVPLLPRFINPAISGCGPTYAIRFDAPESGDVKILFNLNGVPGYQAGTSDRIIELFNVPAGYNEAQWDGLDGLGNNVNNTTTIQLSLILLKGRYNLPIYDAEINSNGIKVSLVAPISVANAQMYWDDSQLTQIGTTCDASFNNTNNITGAGLNNSTVGSVSPSHAWSGDGNLGNVIPAPIVNGNQNDDILCNDFGNLRVINTWGWGIYTQDVFTNAKKGCVDLYVDINVNNTDPNVGSNVTFTILAGNNGTNEGTNINVEAILPTGYTYVSSSQTGGTYNQTTGEWTIPSLTNGQTQTLTIIATVNPQGETNFPTTITGFEFDPDLSNNEDIIRVDAVPVSDLAVVKTVNVSNPQVGSNVIFTITANNFGPSNATGVTVNDLLPSGYTYVSNTTTVGTYNPSNGIWNIGDAPINASGTLTITATVNSTGVYTNLASISGNELDTNPTNNSSSVTPIPTPVSNLSVVKTVSNATPLVGTNVTFTVDITNNGPSNASNTVVNDLLPSGYSYISHTQTAGSYDSATGIWTIGNLPNGTTRTLTIIALVNDSGNYINTAIGTSDNFDPNNTNNTSTATTTPVKNADLSIIKTVSNTTPNVGDNVIFTVEVTNNGPSTANNIIIAEAFPSGYIVNNVTVTTGQYNSNVNWINFSLNPGESATLTANVTVKSTGNYLNTATITSSSVVDPVSSNNTSSALTTPNAVTDLSVLKTVNNTNPTVGSTVVFTILVNNNGPSNATGVTVQDLLPNGYSFVSYTSTGGNYNSTTGVWNIGNIIAINNKTLTITATVNQTGDYLNTATVSGNETDTNPSNNTSSASVTPNNEADLAVTKSVSDATPLVGSQITFTVTVSNNGPSNAQDVEVNDILPSGYTYVSSNATNGFYNSSTGIWDIGNLSNGNGASLDVVVTVNNTGNYTNTATVTQLFTDPNTANNTASASTTPIPTSDLIITKTVDNQTPLMGQNVTFTIELTNAGPSDATGIVVAEALPSGYTYVNHTVTNGNYNQTQWTMSSLASGSSETLTIIALVNPAGNYSNTVNVFANEQDPNLANNTSTSTPTPIPNADLAVVKTVDISSPNVGNVITFTIVATNNGPVNATGVNVSDILPAGYSYLSSTTTTGSYNNTSGLWSIGNLNVGISQTLTITVQVNANGPYTNIANIVGDQFDANLNNNSSISSPLVGQVSDLAVVKTVNNSSPQVGENVTFTITVNNNGTSNATGVIVQDILPSGYIYVSNTSSGGTSYNNTTGIWNIGNLNTTQTKTLTIVATVKNTGNYTNIAIVSGNQSDNNPSNNISSATTTPIRLADLAVTKSVNNVTPTVGDNVVFTIVATNNGPSNATGVIVNDILPDGYQFVNASATLGIYNNGNGNWVINNLTNGSTATLTITVKVKGSGNYLNTASINGNELDNVSSNDSASASTNPVNNADLAITNTVDITTPIVGSNVIFTIIASNNGLSNGTGVTVSNILPNGYTFVSSNSSAGTFDSSTGVWTIGNLNYGESQVIEIMATVLPFGDYTDIATITGNEIDSDLSNNTAEAFTMPIPVTEIAITKTASDDTPNVGSEITFTIQVVNNGPSNATNVVVNDHLLSGYTYVSNTTTTGSYNSVTGVWTIGNLNNTQTETMTITAIVNTNGNYNNTANVSLTEYDSDPTNNSSSITPIPVPISDLNIIKTVNDETPLVGTNVIFTLVASNDGPSVATGVSVTDLLPSGYTYVSYNATYGTYNNVTGAWTIGNLNNGQTQTLNITATVLNTGNYVNSATISGTNLDSVLENNTSTALTTPILSSDISILKQVDISTPDVSGNVIFSIVVTNHGPSDASAVLVNDLLPSGYTYVSNVVSAGTYSFSTGEWSIGNLANLQSETIEITATVNATGNYTNIATVGAAENDPNLTNNTSSATTTPWPMADVGITKVVDNTTPNVGANVTFTIQAYNNGPSTATGTTVSDLLPTGYTYVSHTASTGTYNAASGLWTIGNLNNAGTETLTIIATVNTTGNYVNTAIIDANENDTNTSNTQASASTTPVKLSDLSVTKTVDNSTPLIGSNVTFTIVASNNGISNATGVRVDDVLPNGYIYISHTSTIGTYNLNTGVWNIGNMNVGDVYVFTVVAQVNYTGNYENFAEISGDQVDPNTADNIDSAITYPTDTKSLSDDFAGPINGLEGGIAVVNVLDNDFYNGVPVDINEIILTTFIPDPNGYITLQSDGTINVAPNTPAGNYTLTYQVCNQNLPTDCATAIATIQVVGPTIVANDDDYSATPINSTTGYTDLFNVYSNDVYNLNFVNPADVTLTLVDPTNTNFSINPLTGAITVNSNLPAGVYTFQYQICGNLNPTTNCDTATVTIKIESSKVEIKALLQGSLFSTVDGKMRDDLRTNNVIPLTEPYTAMGTAGNSRFNRPDFTTSEQTTNAILSITGDNAIVDWVFIELRDPADNSIVMHTKSALIQRDGDIVESTDGTSALTFNNLTKTSYFISVKHRNHLGVMTNQPVSFNGSNAVFDFTTADPTMVWNSTASYEGFEQEQESNGKYALWAGNTNADNKVKYSGPNNDQGTIFNSVLNYLGNDFNNYNFNNAYPGYFMGDVNMDAKVKYRAVGNDPTYIFFNIVTKYTPNVLDLYNYDLLREQTPN
jgi:large repetitive protein